jgi:hypothetical protein
MGLHGLLQGQLYLFYINRDKDKKGAWTKYLMMNTQTFLIVFVWNVAYVPEGREQS